jgi:CitMHS family citrate-Mg2+:H+ or citrate-Ca2+:H+ symporter
MLAIYGFCIILLFLLLIWSKKVSVIVALVVTPILLSALAGFKVEEIGNFALGGVLQVSPTAVLLMFAVLYFSIMLDSGLFDPVVSKVLLAVKGDPMKVVIGTALLAMLVHLDGDGTATFMIVISAFLPIYEALKMKNLILAGIVALAVGPIHLVPWSGTSARALSVFEAGSAEIFIPNLPAIGAGIVWVLLVAWYWGRKERNRLGVVEFTYVHGKDFSEDQRNLRRPGLIWINAVLTVSVIVLLMLELIPSSVLFLITSLLALQINYPKLHDQKKVLSRHGNNIFLVVSMIFAAGVFSGILTGGGMIEAMAQSLVSVIKPENSGMLVLITAVTSMPASIIFTPDAYYFGVLPVIKESASQLNIDTLQFGRAALLGQMTVGFPLSPLTASTFLLIGMSDIDLADHQKHTFLWAWGTTLVMTVVAVLTRSIYL